MTDKHIFRQERQSSNGENQKIPVAGQKLQETPTEYRSAFSIQQRKTEMQLSARRKISYFVSGRGLRRRMLLK